MSYYTYSDQTFSIVGAVKKLTAHGWQFSPQVYLTYSYVRGEDGLVHGERPDVKVVDRLHPLHC